MKIHWNFEKIENGGGKLKRVEKQEVLETSNIFYKNRDELAALPWGVSCQLKWPTKSYLLHPTSKNDLESPLSCAEPRRSKL